MPHVAIQQQQQQQQQEQQRLQHWPYAGVYNLLSQTSVTSRQSKVYNSNSHSSNQHTVNSCHRHSRALSKQRQSVTTVSSFSPGVAGEKKKRSPSGLNKQKMPRKLAFVPRGFSPLVHQVYDEAELLQSGLTLYTIVKKNRHDMIHNSHYRTVYFPGFPRWSAFALLAAQSVPIRVGLCSNNQNP